jgi:S-adenosylmethionine/arginine decarboxylase-like enzyme
MNENAYWGYHLIINAGNCNREAVTNPELISKFAKDLVKNIDMVAFGEPQVVHFGEGNKAGYTLVQLIETSNIVAHLCDESGDMYLDVFSCKTFDQNVVLQMVDDYFLPTRMNHHYLERQA